MPSSSHDQPIYEPEATTTTTSSSSSARTALFDQAAHSHGGRVRCPPQLMQAAGSPPRLMPTPPQPPLPSASLPFSGSPHRLACSPPSSSLYPSAAAARSMHSFARMTPELTISQHPMCRGGHADGVHTMHELTAVPASATSLTSTPNSQNKLSGGQGTSREGMNTKNNNNNNTNNSSNGSSVSSSHASSRQTRPHSSPDAAIGAAASISGTKTNRLLYGKEESDEVEAGRKAHTAMCYAGYSQGAAAAAAAAAAERNAASPSLSSPSYTHSATAAVVVAAAAPMQTPYLSRPGFTRSESSGNSTTAASPPALLLPTQPPPPVLSSSSPSGATMTLPVRGPVHHHHHHGLPATMAAQTQAASKPKAFLFSTSAKLVSENARFCAEGVVGEGDMAASAGADAVMTSTSSHHSGSPDKQSMATTVLLRSMPASSPPHAPPGQVHTDTNNSNNNYTNSNSNSNSNSGSRRHASPGQSGSSHSPSRQLLHGPSPPTTAPPPPDAARSHTRLAKLLHVAAATQPPPLLTALQPSHDPSTSAAAPATQQYLSATAYEATGLKRNSTSSAVPSPSLDALVSYASTNTVLTSPAEAASHFTRDAAAALTPLTVPAEVQRRADASQSEAALAATTSATFMNTSSSSVTSSSLAGTTPGATSTSATAVRRVKRRPASLFISPQSVQSGEASRPHFAAVTNNNSSNTMLAGLAPGKEPSGLRRPRAMSEHALYNTTGGAAAGEQPRSNTTTTTATASSSQANAMPALQPMNAFGLSSQPCQELSTISFISSPTPGGNGLTDTRGTTTTTTATASMTTMANNALLQGSSNNNNNIIIGSGLQSQQPQLSASFAATDLAGRPCARLNSDTTTTTTTNYEDACAMPCSYPHNKAASSATFSSSATQELQNLSSLPALSALPQLDSAAAYMPSAIKPSTKAKREGNGDGVGGEEEEEEEEEERASIPFSALRALHAAHQCSMTSEACRPAAKATAPRDGGNDTPSATTALPSSAAAAAAAATTLRGLHVDILPAPQSARRGAMPVQGAHTSSNADTGSTLCTIQRVDREVEEGRQGAAAVIGGAVGHRDAAAMAILQPQAQQEKQQPVHHQGHSPHFASAAATAVQHRKAAAPSPLRQGRQLAGRQGQPCGGQQPHRRRRRRPLVRLAHDGKTLIAGDFRVCEMGCLTIRNFLLLNPQHSQQDKGMSGTAATMPQLAEMRMAHGVAAAAMTFTAAESHGPGPLLRPERLCGMTIGSSVAATEEDRAVCEAMQATLGKSGVYDAGSGEAKPGQLLTRMDSGGSHVVGQACTAARGSQHAGVTIATTTITRTGNTNTTAIVPDILLRSPVVSSPAITPTSAALTPDALLCPCISPGLLMMEEGGETDYGMTSTALPCYTPAMTTITPARTRGRSGTMHENASFTLQSTSMNMPYSPITYSMDSLHYPETMTPCTSKLGRTANTAGAGGATTQTRRLLRARRELTPGLAHARYSGSLTNLIAQEAEPQLSRTTGQPPQLQQQYHGMAQGNLPGTPSCLRPSSAQMPHAMTPLIGSSAAPVLQQPQSSTTAFGTGLRVFRRCSSGGLNNFMNTTTTSNNTNNNNSSSGQVAGMQAFALGTGLPPQSPMSCLPAALAMSTTRGGTRPCAGNTTCANNGAVLGSSGGALMPSAAPSRALTATNTSLTLHGGDTPTSCTAGPLLPPPPPPPQPQPTHMHPASNAEDSMMVAGSLLPYVDIAPEQQRQQLLTAAQHAEVSAAVNTPLTRQRMMMSLQNVVRYGDLDIQLAVGEGASASVFLAIHRPTGRRLAVKRVNLEPLCLDARTAFGKSGNLFTYACDSARAQQLRYIIVRELQVLHLTYRSPFMVKVYNAFYLPDIAALDIVMEFMHYGSIDDLAKCLQRHARSEVQRRNTNTMSVDGEAVGKGKKEQQQHEVGENDKQLQQQEGHEEASTQGAHTTPDTLATKKGNGSYAPSPHPAEAEAMALQTSEASYGCGGHRHHPRGTSLSGQLSPPITPITDMNAAHKDSQIAAADAAAAVSVASPDIRVLPAPSSTPLSPDNGPAAVNAAVAEHHDGPLQASVPHAVSADASASSSSPLLLSSALLSAAQREAQQRRNAKRPLPFALPTLAVSAVLTGAASSSGGSSTLDHTSDDLLSHRTHERQASLPGMEEEVCGVCERVVAVVGEQLLCGVRDMHARNFIHRDIKPGNVLVNEHAVVKLSDFGLSQRCSDAAGVKGRGAGRRQQQQQQRHHHHHHHSRAGSSRRTHRSGKRGRTSGTQQQQQQAHHTGDETTSMTAQRPLAEDSHAAATLLLQGQQRRSSVSLVASGNTRTASSSSSSSASVTTPASIVASSSSSSSSASSYNNNNDNDNDDDERKGCNGFAYRGGNDSHSDEDSNSSSSSSTTATSDAMYGGGEEDEDEEEDDVHCSGTLNYMSPERLRGEPHGKPSDIWAVGVTLAEFAVGAYPYNLHDLTDIFDRLYRMEQPIDFAPFNARRVTPLSAVFQDFIRLATLAAPSQRPTAHELLEHPFFKQWSTPFDLKSYLAARVPAPAPVTINSNGASRVKAAAQL